MLIAPWAARFKPARVVALSQVSAIRSVRFLLALTAIFVPTCLLLKRYIGRLSAADCRLTSCLKPGKPIAGMNKAGADHGIIATAGTVSQEAERKVEALADDGLQIVILDGEKLATLYLDYCVGSQRRVV